MTGGPHIAEYVAPEGMTTPAPKDNDHSPGTADTVRPRYEWVADALAEAIELVEEYAQYVSPFLLEKWGHADDVARLRAVLTAALIDGSDHEPDNPLGVWCCQEHRVQHSDGSQT